MVASAIFDPLATIDDDGEVVPYLAESIEPVDDEARQWTITVRDGVTFHDGTPLTSAEVKAGLDAMADSVVTADALAPLEQVEVVDERTVRLTMSEPWSAFPATLTTQVGYVVPVPLTEDLSTLAQPVGTGPFRFVEWVEGERVTVARNEDYWQEGKPHLDEIVFRPYPDATERMAALRNGQVDVVHTYTPGDIQALRQDSALKVLEVATGEEDVIMLNTSVPPFDRLEARTAVARATDIDRYIRETGHEGVAEASRGPFSPGQLGHREDNGYLGYDLEAARADVAAYEEATGSPLRFTLTGANTVEQRRIQQLLIAMWTEAGMEVEIRPVEQGAIILNSATGNFEAVEFRNFGAVDPDADLMWWRGGDDPEAVTLNFPRFADPEIEAAARRARATNDDDERDAAFADIAQRLTTQAPYVWLIRVNWALAAQPRVHGIGAAANGTLATLGPKTWLADLWVG
jgi:peptide/nickel transport system substrate-binding protein